MKKFGIEGNKKILKFLVEIPKKGSEEDLYTKFDEVFGVSVEKLLELKGGK